MPPINRYQAQPPYATQPMPMPALQPQQYYPQQTMLNDMYVQGEQQAQNYPVAPNATIRLWDSTNDCFYMKTADAMGNITMRTFDYTERGTQPQQMQVTEQPNFSDEIARLEDKFQRQINRLNSIVGNMRKENANG